MPTSSRADRKRVILASDYQSEWNREIIAAAGRALGGAVNELPALLGARRFWQLTASLKETADRAVEGRIDPTLAEFWRQIKSQLRTSSAIQTTTGKWVRASESCLLLQREEATAVAVLEAIGIDVTHEDLRPFQSLLRSEAVGVPILDIGMITTALTELGLNGRTELGDLPPGLRATTQREALWVEIATLLDRQQRTPRVKAEDERRLRQIALAPGRDGALWPCHEIYSADAATIALFEPLDLAVTFLAGDRAFEPLRHLCKRFEVDAAVEALGRLTGQELNALWQKRQLPLRRLHGWFEDRRSEILSNATLKRKLGDLALFPSSGTLYPLNKLALPGNFADPLGLADLVDIAALGGRREFLQDLGMPELDFRAYVSSRLPQALSRANVPSAKRRDAIFLLASRIGLLRDNDGAREALADIELVECTDGLFRTARECHFDTEPVQSCLGSEANLAVIPAEHASAVRDLYGWLGVAGEPRLEAIVEKVQEFSTIPHSRDNVQQIQKILAHLGKRVEASEHFSELIPLKRIRWLPARGRRDRWYAPGELYATYQSYLFDTQAIFLDAPITVQNASRTLLQFLGVRLTPAADLVVRHLLHCAEQKIAVNAEVYRFLNERVSEATLAQLRGSACLWLGDAYYAPNEVFWGEHSFGRYRRQLGEELRSYAGLLKFLGVRETPTWEDALAVLHDVVDEFAPTNRPLDQEAHAVLMGCWRAIGQALDDGTAVPEALVPLRSVKCVPDARRVLNRPDWMFFENRAGLAEKFSPFLSNNVIPRPIGTGHALDAAGVRPLGTAARIELLECVNPVEDVELGERVRARRNEIGRILEAHGAGHDTSAALDRIDDIQFQSAVTVEIRYRLNVFNRELESAPEKVPALYEPDQQTIGHLEKFLSPSRRESDSLTALGNARMERASHGAEGLFRC